MTRAICIKCGQEKHGAWTPCLSCGHAPFGVHDLAWSLVFSDQTMTHEGLDDLHTYMLKNGRAPEMGEAVLKAWQERADGVRSRARGLIKRGLLPLEDAPEANEPLVGNIVSISLPDKIRFAIEDFCLEQVPPAKPKDVIEWIVEEWLSREGYLD